MSRTVDLITEELTPVEPVVVYQPGDIRIHNGTLLDIPEGWVLCDGQNGTPNMVDRAVVGAGGAYQPGETFGADSAATASHTLTTAQVPSHSHNFNVTKMTGDLWAGSLNGGYTKSMHTYTNATHSTGSSHAHNHGTIDTRQQSIAIIWIMKL